MLFDGNTTSVIFDGNGAVVIDLDDDGAGKTCHCFVDGVIDDFADEVMESSAGGIADVHSRTLSDVLLIGEMFEVFGGIIFIGTGQNSGRNGKLFCRFSHRIIIA